MYPRPVQKLIEHFQRLPGIGPKQGARFAFRVLGMRKDEIERFAKDLLNIQGETSQCTQCRLTFERDKDSLCPICRNPARDQNLVCVVETERDAYTIEQSRAFSGVYHVLGERISLRRGELSEPTVKFLEKRIEGLNKDAEVVLALSATTESQATGLWLERALAPTQKKITRLGRGLSSGIEIEYADRDTLMDAFSNRK